MVMDGMLIQSEIDKLSSDGILKTDNKLRSPLISVDKLSFSPRISLSANKMSDVYIAFYCLENSVRELVTDRLVERKGTDWWNKCVPEKVRKKVSELQLKESKNKYHAQRSTINLGYTLFGDLSDIIISNWSEFADILPSQAWITSRFNDLEMSRNVIMHSGVLPDDEIDRIKTYVQDWVEQVG